MADSKLTALSENTAPSSTDIIYEVQDPAGTPASKKVQFANLHKAMTVFTGDSGAGGYKGLVPAPAAGDAAATKYLNADGTWKAVTIPPSSSYDFLSTLTSAEIALSVGGTATISRMHTVGGTTAGTVLLPTAGSAAGKFIAFRFTNTATTVLDGLSSETIDGATIRPYYQGQAVKVMSDGSNWHTLNGVTAPRAASVSTLTMLHSAAQTIQINTSQALNMWTYQTSPANGDSFTFSVYLTKGTYTLAVLGETQNVRPILDWTINGTSITTGQDWYSASAVYNVIKTASLTVPYTGYHVIKGTVNGKNASSSNYYYAMTQVDIYPAAY